MYQDILYEVDDPVATITINRPDRLNAFTRHTLGEIRDAVETAGADPDVVGIVITGEGRGFCAGLDAEDLTQATEEGAAGQKARALPPEETPGLFSYLLKIQKPVIAAVNGPCAGGGFVMACLCDIRFASPSAAFVTVFSKRGLIAEHGITWALPRLIGQGRAMDLLWSSRKVGGEEAARIGLVEFLTGDDDLLASAQDYVRDLAANASPASMADTKRMIYEHFGQEYDPAFRDAAATILPSLERPDAAEGVASFVERRPPAFPRLGAKA